MTKTIIPMRRNKGLLEKKWERYRQALLPSDTPEIEVLRCQHVFYSGAAALFSIVMNETGDPPKTEAMLRDLDREFEEFHKNFRQVETP